VPRLRPPDPRALLVRFAETQATASARAAFDAEQTAGLRAVRASLGRRRAAPLTYGDVENVSRALGGAQVKLARAVFDLLLGKQRAAATAALDGVQRLLASHDPAAAARAALSDTTAFERATVQRRAEDWAAARHLLADWAARRQADARVMLRTAADRGASVGDALARTEAWADAGWGRVERLVRTETAYAFNAAADVQIRTYAALAPRGAEVRKRWVEHVDDHTGRALDARVAADSLVLHGQLAVPDGTFAMPHDPRVTPKLWGTRFRYPPNRPNDRAVVLPWAPGWGGIAWELQNGERWARM
jgi:hypothetical protein